MRRTSHKAPIGPSGHFPRERGKNEQPAAAPTQDRWRHWFSFAVLRLGLSPDAFWALSVTEWRWLLTAALGDGAGAMDAAALSSLLNRYPDRPPCPTP